ncbi:MAG: SLC13 family permease [Desulfobacteraceae bacterium]|nr:SLC13 family permease [Desulfobacteraceae bacterium]
MPAGAPLIFVLTYAGVALGHIPGLKLDRTGIAVLGAIAMVSGGFVSLRQAVAAIDFPTILLLYALMIVSAQLRLGGFYTRIAKHLAASLSRPRLFLLLLMLSSAGLSALLANDIICLAFTPVLLYTLLPEGYLATPFLLGLAVSSNIGSAATLIGNPQNMLIGQVGRLAFGPFLAFSIFPVVFSLLAGYLLICWRYGGKMAAPMATSRVSDDRDWPPFNAWQSAKGLLAVAALIGLFFTPTPRELSAMAVAGVLLCSRRLESRQILKLVDWQLLTLFCSLFVVVEGVTNAGLPQMVMAFLGRHGLTLTHPPILTLTATALSNLVSNVPATVLLIKFLDPRRLLEWYILAISSTFAGNLMLVGSIANLIVVEQAGAMGVRLTFGEHLRIGAPITALSLLFLLGWLAIHH